MEEIILSPYHLIISISLVFRCPLHSSSLCILYRLQVPSLGRWSFITCHRWQIPSITTSTQSAIIQQSLASHPASVGVIRTNCRVLRQCLLSYKYLDNVCHPQKLTHVQDLFLSLQRILMSVRFVKSRWGWGRAIIERDLRKLVFVPNRDKRQSWANGNNQRHVLF